MTRNILCPIRDGYCPITIRKITKLKDNLDNYCAFEDGGFCIIQTILLELRVKAKESGF